MKYPLFAMLVLLCSGSICYAGDADWGPWGSEAITFPEQNRLPASRVEPETGLNAAKHTQEPSSQHEEKVVYGTGIIGRDENLLHELDQSSLLDYQLTIEIDEPGFGTLPEGGEFSTQPFDPGIESSFLLDDAME